jgi:hypothetical protein
VRDRVYLVLVTAFFTLTALFVAACARIVGAVNGEGR